jgi:bacterioferritin-associated ferredoxin
MYVCICARVRECEVRAAVQAGARTEQAVGEACGAGTGCGTCLDRVDVLLAASLGQGEGSMFIALLGLSIPNFWQGLIFILNFSIKLQWLPATFSPGNWLSIVMPAVVLGTALTASIARMTRSSTLEIINEDYIITAKAKGLNKHQVLWKHAVGNAMIPIITVIGLLFGGMLGGAAVTEKVFNISGIGSFIVDKQFIPDIPSVMGGVVGFWIGNKGGAGGGWGGGAPAPGRAAGLPPIRTVVLPSCTVARLDGGCWNGPPAGTCAGVLVAVLPCTAAGAPPMRTFVARPPSRVPANGCGSGVGTGPPGEGMSTTCVSVATTRSPCFAAGSPIAFSPVRRVRPASVDVHVGALERQHALRLDAHLGAADLHVALTCNDPADLPAGSLVAAGTVRIGG